MAEIYLSGKYSHIKCIIDDEDYERISKYNWFYNNCGYAVKNKTINSPKQYMHRMIMNAEKGQIVDHINRNTYDNRKANLRFVNKSQNAFNSKRRTTGISGTTGVYWSKVKNKWTARIKGKRKEMSLGYYLDKNDAIRARKNAEKKYVRY